MENKLLAGYQGRQQENEEQVHPSDHILQAGKDGIEGSRILSAINGTKTGKVLQSHSVGLGMGLNEIFVDLRQLSASLSRDKTSIILSPAYQLIFSLQSITCLWVLCASSDRDALVGASGKIATALRSLGGFSIVAIQNHTSRGLPFAGTRRPQFDGRGVAAFKYVIVASLTATGEEGEQEEEKERKKDEDK